MSEDIPAWAEVAKIDRRHPAPKNKREWARYADELRSALADCIAAHEEPPVDPLDAAIGEAFDRLPPAWNRDIFVASVGKTLRERGIELGTSQ